MNKLTITFLLLLAGGITSMQVFFCKIPGCAANVRWVFCNNIDVYGRDHVDITDCKGHYPPLNSVCKHEGLAFVSTDMAGECEFESTNEYISTESCRDHSNICDFSSADIITKPDDNIKALIGTVTAVIVIVFLVGSVTAYFCKKRGNPEQNQQSSII